MPIKLAISDIARAVALPVTHSRQGAYKAYNVSSSSDELDEVRRQLHTRRARSYPPYVLSVLSAYIRYRGVSKKGRPQLEATLQKLESEFPEFGAEFRAVHKSFGLQRDGSVDKHPRRSVCPCAHHTQQAAALDAREASKAPPPPYTPDEANHDLSRLLAYRLAAEAGVASNLYDAGRDAEDTLSALGAPMSRTGSDTGASVATRGPPAVRA